MSAFNTPTRAPPRRNASFARTSPLVQTRQPSRLRSKFSVSYEALLNGEHPWLYTPGSTSSSIGDTPLASSASSQLNGNGSGYFTPSGKKSSAPRSRFFADLLCLKVEPDTIQAILAEVPARQLIDDDETSKGARIRENIGSMWRECLRVWQDVSEYQVDARFGSSNTSDEFRRASAVDTLVELSRGVLAKNFVHSSSSLDLIWIFAGGIDDADDVFEDLISALDRGLRGELDNPAHRMRMGQPTRLPRDDGVDLAQRNAMLRTEGELPSLSQLLHHRRRAVHLAIVWISYASATNLSAYFVRRDLFVGACDLLTVVQSLLRTAQRGATAPNQGLADEDVDLLRLTIKEVALLIGLLAGLGQTNTGTGLGGGFKPFEASSSLYFRRMCEWADAASMQLVRDALVVDLIDIRRSFEKGDEGEGETDGISTTAGITASLGAMTDGLRKMALATETVIDPDSPSRSASCLLSIYLLCRANQAFVDVAMRSSTPAKAGTAGCQLPTPPVSFAASLLTASSYLATHASHNERARAYSRLVLLIPLTLLSSPLGIAALVTADRPEEAISVKLCSQRAGPLPMRMQSDGVPAGSSWTSLLSQWTSSIGLAGQGESKQRTRLLPFVLDICVQYLRHNLRKRLDMSGYLVCLHLVQSAIHACADHQIRLEYGGSPDLWSTLTTVLTFLVGRHSELRGVEIGKMGQALLSTFGVALLESDRVLATRKDVDVLVYELVRSTDSLRKLAAICAGKTTTSNTNDQATSALTPEAARALTLAVPTWRLIDLTLLGFEEKLNEWSVKRGSATGLGTSLSTWTMGLLGSSNTADTGSSPAAADTAGPATARRRPGISTVLSLIASLDMERIVHLYQIDIDGGASRSASSRQTAHRSSTIEEEWLERAEAHSLAEAFRYAAEDVRAFVR